VPLLSPFSAASSAAEVYACCWSSTDGLVTLIIILLEDAANRYIKLNASPATQCGTRNSTCDLSFLPAGRSDELKAQDAILCQVHVGSQTAQLERWSVERGKVRRKRAFAAIYEAEYIKTDHATDSEHKDARDSLIMC